MSEALICDAIRTPFGRFTGGLSSIRTDDLAALPIQELIKRNPDLDWGLIDDVIYASRSLSGTRICPCRITLLIITSI